MAASRYDGVTPFPCYDLTAPNAGLPIRGGLRDLCDVGERNRNGVPPFAFRGVSQETWIDAVRLEELLDEDAELFEAGRAAVAAIMAADDGTVTGKRTASRRVDSATAALTQHVQRVFADTLLVEIVTHFDAVAVRVAQYVLAKHAIRKNHPHRFPEPPQPDNPIRASKRKRNRRDTLDIT